MDQSEFICKKCNKPYNISERSMGGRKKELCFICYEIRRRLRVQSELLARRSKSKRKSFNISYK